VAKFDAAITDFDNILRVARRRNDRRLESRALAYRGWFELFAHTFDRSEESFKAAIKQGEDIDDAEIICTARVGFSYLFGVVGRHNESKAEWLKGLALGGKGEYDHALRLLHKTIASCRRVGNLDTQARALNTMGWIYSELQDHQRGIELNREGIEVAQEERTMLGSIDADSTIPGGGVQEKLNNARLNLADSLLALGRINEAEKLLKDVEKVVRDPVSQDRWMHWRYSQHLFHSYGELWLMRGVWNKAMAFADECLIPAEQSNSEKNVVKGRRLRGQVLIAQDRLQEAEKEISKALKSAMRVGNPPQIWKTYAVLEDSESIQEINT
jgi:tetratricopeptide (TPR) repeat protein